LKGYIKDALFVLAVIAISRQLEKVITLPAAISDLLP
jgi:hypothetical protein